MELYVDLDNYLYGFLLRSSPLFVGIPEFIKVGTNEAGIYLNLIPMFVTLFATLFINERLLLLQIIGGVFFIDEKLIN